jgi:hypothetical protein
MAADTSASGTPSGPVEDSVRCCLVQAIDAAFGVNIEWSFEPPGQANHVHIQFTAPYRENHVTDWGEVKWEINRGYEGQWFLYWSE